MNEWNILNGLLEIACELIDLGLLEFANILRKRIRK